MVAEAVVDAQELLDEHLEGCLAQLERRFDAAELRALPPGLLEAVLPMALRIEVTRFEVDMQVELERGRGGANMRMSGGRPASAFSQARFVREQHSLHLCFEVRAVPVYRSPS